MTNLDIGDVSFDKDVLKRHLIALGGTGSGKTVLCKKIIEECGKDDIPSILIDTQGDLGSLALRDDNLDVSVYTPGSSKGIPLSINPLSNSFNKEDEEEKINSLNTISNSICNLVGYDLSKDKGKSAQAFLYKLLEDNSFDDFIELDNFLESMSEEDLERFSGIISYSEFKSFRKKIKFLTIGKKKLLFNHGVKFDVDDFLDSSDISVIYLNSLDSFEEKDFFLSLLVSKIYDWMLDKPSESLQSLFFVDEVSSFLPSGSSKSLSSDILKILFKQARKYGVGCMVSTQNPGDIDYKSFGQFNTWCIGRLNTEQDKSKIKKGIGLDSLGGVSGLSAGEFKFYSPDQYDSIRDVKVKRLDSEHKTLTIDEISDLMSDKKDDFDFSSESVSEDNSVSDSFSCINPERRVDDVIESLKKKRFHFFGGKVEEVKDYSVKYVPVLKCVIRKKDGFFWSKSLSDYSVYFSGVSGDIVLPREYSSSRLVGLGENELDHFKVLIKDGGRLSTGEVNELVDSSDSLSVLKRLNSDRLIGKNKKGRGYEWYSLVDMSFSPVKKLSKNGFSLDTGECLDGDFLDFSVDKSDVFSFVRGFFDGDVFEDELFYYPVLDLELVSKSSDSTRSVMYDLVKDEEISELP